MFRVSGALRIFGGVRPGFGVVDGLSKLLNMRAHLHLSKFRVMPLAQPEVVVDFRD